MNVCSAAKQESSSYWDSKKTKKKALKLFFYILSTINSHGMHNNFRFLHENVFIAIVIVSCKKKFMHRMMLFKYKFYVENYKKCISCELHRTKFPLDALFIFIYYMSGIRYVFMAIWWLMCIYIYACLFLFYIWTQKNNTT